ncbi:hypothetical protein ACFV0C_36940 [Streptomyces sp. NPDC059568]|uniref:hypothetical protein n=1 Tax=Streptomyces sp. NPDC059568 TaxID=3346868 RepID=UPI00367D982E
MSLQEHVNGQTKSREEVRDAILDGIAEAVEESKNLVPNSRATALKDLAEAYAWVSSPGHPH